MSPDDLERLAKQMGRTADFLFILACVLSCIFLVKLYDLFKGRKP